MIQSLDDFFSAWGIADQDARGAQIDGTLAAEIFYADPRTQAPLTDPAAIKDYVSQFSKMAPGMAVAVVHTSTTLSFARVTVQFGEGAQSQTGQYIADLDDDQKITRLIGFVGTGTPA